MSTTFDLIISILTIVIPLFGGGITILIFYYRDIMEKEPKVLVIRTFLWGLVIGTFIILFTIPLFILAQNVIDILTKDWAIIFFMIAILLIEAVLEEAAKGFVLWRLCFSEEGSIDGLFDGFFYGAIIGTGAGVVDSIVYSLLATDWLQGLEIALIRTVRIPGTHALFTGIIGIYFAWNKFQGKKITPGIYSSISLHTLWSIVTYLFHYCLVGTAFYIANFAFLGIYLALIFIIISLLIRYDKKHYPIRKLDQLNDIVI